MHVEQQLRGVFVARAGNLQELDAVVAWCLREFGQRANWSYTRSSTSVLAFDEFASELQEAQVRHTLRLTFMDQQLANAFKSEWLQE